MALLVAEGLAISRASLRAVLGGEKSSIGEIMEDFNVRTVDTANREIVAQLKAMNGKLDIINGRFAERLTISCVQLALIIAVPAICGAVGPMILKLLWLRLLHCTW